MELNEVFDILLHCMRYYNDDEFRNHFGLFEYYSITDMSPKDLAKVAREIGNKIMSYRLIEFDSKNSWNSTKITPEKIMKWYQAVNNKEFSDDDKLTIIETLEKEGYPLVDYVYYAASCRYGYYGVDGILKENTRNKLIKFYCESTGKKQFADFGVIEKAKVLTK